MIRFIKIQSENMKMTYGTLVYLYFIWFGSKNNMRNSVNLNESRGKSENVHFDVLLLSIGYKISVKKVYTEEFSHDTEKRSKKKNWLFVCKMTWGIWRILTRVVESLKIFALIGYFCREYVILDLKKWRGVVSWKMT